MAASVSIAPIVDVISTHTHTIIFILSTDVAEPPIFYFTGIEEIIKRCEYQPGINSMVI